MSATSNAIDEACYRLMTDPALEPLRAWWELEALRTAVALEPLTLAAAEGDRARYLTIMARAARARRTDNQKG